MSETKTDPEFDALALWQQLQAANLKAWAKVLNETVASEDFARAMGFYLENYLKAITPAELVTRPAMEQAMQQVNLPTRQELANLAERLTYLEMRLDDLDAKIDEILDGLQAVRSMLTAPPQS
jgi:BMFP domain-containing protein YqiC